MQVAETEHKLYRDLQMINVDKHNRSEIALWLELAFGDSSDPKHTGIVTVFRGQYGLDFFLASIVEPILDTVPPTKDDYDEILTDIGKLCLVLARKIRNVAKASIF